MSDIKEWNVEDDKFCEATGKKVLVTVEVEHYKGDLFLCEIPLYQSPVRRSEFVWRKEIPWEPGRRTITVERVRAGHDRVFSSWVLARQTDDRLVPVSHQRFVDIMPAKWKLTRDRPENRKGIAGLPTLSSRLRAA